MNIARSESGRDKPKTLRAIFLLNALKLLAALGLFIAVRYFDVTVPGAAGNGGGMLLLYTALGYLAVFAGIVAAILKRSLAGLRAAIVIDFLVSIPVKAFVGMAIAIICAALTFAPPVLAYFRYRAS